MPAKEDPKGLYQRLGVSTKASQAEIKTAYRRLAKYLHPDVNADYNAAALFKAVNEAYAVLSNPRLRADYDASAYTEPPKTAAPDLEPMEPIVCSVCKKVAAQPRSIVFSRVVSIIMLTTTSKKGGIYCSSCARKTAFKESLISALFGWWGFPWGLISTPVAILSNARGGEWSQGMTDRLTWYNALAFLSKGQLSYAYALALKARRAAITDIADGAAEMVLRLKARGVPAATLKDPWGRKPFDVLAHLAMLVAVPGIIAAVITLEPPSLRSRDEILEATRKEQERRGPAPQSYGRRPVTTARPSFDEAALPSCSHPIENGDVLVKRGVVDGRGHTIKISNGGSANAIIKVRDARSGALLTSFFVAKDQSASIGSVPDGTYRVQFAFGGELAVDCQSFKYVRSVSQFNEAETLMTRYVEDGIVKKVLSYTLFTVPNGNARSEAIDAAAFNKD